MSNIIETWDEMRTFPTLDLWYPEENGKRKAVPHDIFYGWLSQRRKHLDDPSFC